MHYLTTIFRRFFIVICLCICFLVALVPHPVAAQVSQDVARSYDISRVDPDGSTNTGTLTITRSTIASDLGSVYQLTWNIGTNSANGLGLLHDGNLSVVSGTNGCVLVVYKFTSNGLDAVWAAMTDTKFSTESIPLNSTSSGGKKFSSGGKIQGTNPDGTKYTGTVSADAFGLVSVWKWSTDSGKTYQPGVGLVEADGALDGFAVTKSLSADDKCTVTSYRLGAGGNLYGVWAVVGQKTIGSELAIPQ